MIYDDEGGQFSRPRRRFFPVFSLRAGNFAGFCRNRHAYRNPARCQRWFGRGGAVSSPRNAARPDHPRCRADRSALARLSPGAVRTDRRDRGRQVDPVGCTRPGARPPGGGRARARRGEGGGGIGRVRGRAKSPRPCDPARGRARRRRRDDRSAPAARNRWPQPRLCQRCAVECRAVARTRRQPCRDPGPVRAARAARSGQSSHDPRRLCRASGGAGASLA